MPEKINLTLNINVAGGPKFSASRSINVDAYDKIQVAIPEKTHKVVEVQPGPQGRVQFLFITADKFDAVLTYQVNSSGEEITLDAQQLLIGEGAVGLLDDAPETLTFTNGLEEEVNIEILVGRNVTGP